MQTITQHTMTDQLEFQGTPVLNCQIRYPQFQSTCSKEAVEKVNEYYRAMAQEKGTGCRGNLYREAVNALEYSRSSHYPFYPFEFDVDYKVTYNKDCVVSLYFDQYEFTGGAHGQTVRSSQTWDFGTAKQLSLEDFFQNGTDYIRQIQTWIEYETAGRLKSDPASYFEAYPELIRSKFQEDHFYLTPQGIVIFYQQYEIAPYSSGLPEFLLLFSEE